MLSGLECWQSVEVGGGAGPDVGGLQPSPPWWAKDAVALAQKLGPGLGDGQDHSDLVPSADMAWL